MSNLKSKVSEAAPHMKDAATETVDKVGHAATDAAPKAGHPLSDAARKAVGLGVEPPAKPKEASHPAADKPRDVTPNVGGPKDKLSRDKAKKGLN